MKTILIGPSANLKGINFENSYVIAVDAGLDLLLDNNYRFDVALGDFDSSKKVKEIDEKIIKFPIKKDQSDFELALIYCKNNNYLEIEGYGFLSSARLDHLFNNLLLLNKYSDLSIVLYDDNHRIRLLKKGDNHLKKEYKYYSFFALEKSIISLEKGFKYNVINLGLDPSVNIAISNEINSNATVSIIEGKVILIESNGE